MTKTYTTISGDEWDVICYKHYGEGGEKYMDQVINCNPSFIHVVEFPAGIKLEIPEIDTSITTQNKPPWMR